MTPEQILIDGLIENCYCKSLNIKGAELKTCRYCKRIQAYNEAKAQEPDDKDLLETAVLKSLDNIYATQKAWSIKGCKDDKPIDIDFRVEIFLRGVQKRFDELEAEATVKESLAVQNLLTANPLAEALREHKSVEQNLPCGCHLGTFNCLQEALIQHEALIKQSEAVWAVVKRAVKHAKYGTESTEGALRDRVRALPKEVLEMMEGKAND